MSGPGWGFSGWGDPFTPPVGFDPNDPFDQLLTGQATILRKAGVTKNDYGIPDQTLVVLEDHVPCRLSTLGAGSEYKDPKQAALRKFKVFMRPRAYLLAETHWLEIEARKFNISSVIQVRARDHNIHHLEVFVDEVIPSQVVPPSAS